MAGVGQDLVLETEYGQAMDVGPGPSTYSETLDLALSVGDQISATDFHEDGRLQVMDLTNNTTAQRAILRDDTGRPAWAGPGTT